MFRRQPRPYIEEAGVLYAIIVEESHRFQGAIGALVGAWIEHGVLLGAYLRLPGNLLVKVASPSLRHVRPQDAPVHLLQNDIAATAAKTTAYLENETTQYRAAVRLARHRAVSAARAKAQDSDPAPVPA